MTQYHPPPPGPPPNWIPQGPPPGWNGSPTVHSNQVEPGPDAPYRPYPPAQHAPPPGPPPQQYGSPNAALYAQQAPPSQIQDGRPVHFQPPPGPPPQDPFYYRYSDLSGRKKALFIGINYVGSRNELRGCHNDVRNVSTFLRQRYGYAEEDMVILLDDPNFGYRQQPTRRNMEEAMQWLVGDARPNDALFFHYSGHGGQSANPEEESGYDDTICPVDFEQAGQIIDDELHALLVAPLPAGCRLTAILDSCHSGTAMDLPYIYDHTGNIKQPNVWQQAGSGAMTAAEDYLRGDVFGAVTSLFGAGRKFMHNNDQQAIEQARRMNFSPADVLMFSGCKDDQTSADASEAGQATGAMSWAFLTALTKYPQQSYIQLLLSIRAELASRYSQKPQMSSSHPVDTNLLFVM